MSPELNGNSPPTATKRKKKRDRKHSCGNSNDCCGPPYNGFPTNKNSYLNLTVPDGMSHYPFLNYSTSSEPMSLPVYPTNYQPFTLSANPSSCPRFGLPQNYAFGSNDFASLPLVNTDANDVGRHSDSGPNDSDSSSTSANNTMIQQLTHQLNILKESNRKLTREVTELKMEVSLVKQQQSSRHYEKEYEPGMIAEFIRDLREAARVREDALIARVKHMIEEKQLSMNQFHVVAERHKNNDRLSKLEEQVKNLSITNRSEDSLSIPSSSTAMEDGANSAHQIIELEREALLLRRELQEARAKKEEYDQRLQQLDKRLSHLLGRKDAVSEAADNYNKSTANKSNDSLLPEIPSVHPTVALNSSSSQRITLSGPVTNL